MRSALRTLLTSLAILLLHNSIAQPIIERNNTQSWYGRVNGWHTSRSLLKQELDLMQECGVSGYMIELAGWGHDVGEAWNEEWINTIKKEYRHILRQCRKRDLWLFVSIINDNMGRGKYGDRGPSLEVVYDYAQQLISIIKRFGSRNVMVQPVAETQTSAGERFEREALTQLSDFILVYNGDGGSPKRLLEGFDFRAIHPSHITSSLPSDALIISDHGLIIRELSADGGLQSAGDPEKVKRWAEHLHKEGVPVVGYYAFLYNGFDPATIRALGCWDK
ncbi:MAG: hypothetical protein IKU22_10585 [Alistipes sp.]|nr:hypothetical protein [Alistipes sp.]